MTVGVGVIGTGQIGIEHVQRIANQVSGARVAAVFDVADERATAVADEIGAVARTSASDVIGDDAVDAVLVASSGDLHAEQVVACVEAGKPVLCEKPLAPTTEACREVLDAEMSTARSLVRVGFMRRYDEGYLRLRDAVLGGDIGEPLLAHCLHRNRTAPSSFTGHMAITDSVIHEVDAMRWLLGEEVVVVSTRAGKKSPYAPARDPQLVLFETTSGVLVDVESFVNCQYGYDVRCELVGSEGYATLGNPTISAVASHGRRSTSVPADWQDRFGDAFRREVQAWVDEIGSGSSSAATAWDGYAATAIAQAAVRALRSGERVEVDLPERPVFYATDDPRVLVPPDPRVSDRRSEGSGAATRVRGARYAKALATP